MKEVKGDELTLVGTPELGKHLIDAATDKIQERMREKVLGCVSDLINKKRAIQQQIDGFNAELNSVNTKLKEIEAGHFSLGKNGEICFD